VAAAISTLARKVTIPLIVRSLPCLAAGPPTPTTVAHTGITQARGER